MHGTVWNIEDELIYLLCEAHVVTFVLTFQLEKLLLNSHFKFKFQKSGVLNSKIKYHYFFNESVNGNYF